MDKNKVVGLLKKAEDAVRSSDQTIKGLQAQVSVLQTKEAELNTLKAENAKRVQCEKLAARMVEIGRIDESDRFDKVAALMKEKDLGTIEKAVDILAEQGDDYIGTLGKQASPDSPQAKFWATVSGD